MIICLVIKERNPKQTPSPIYDIRLDFHVKNIEPKSPLKLKTEWDALTTLAKIYFQLIPIQIYIFNFPILSLVSFRSVEVLIIFFFARTLSTVLLFQIINKHSPFLLFIIRYIFCVFFITIEVYLCYRLKTEKKEYNIKKTIKSIFIYKK